MSNETENVLVIGSGGREHALAWKLASEGADVWVAPGNGGIPEDRQITLNTKNFPEIIEAAQDLKTSLVVIGPEEPLVGGLADALREHGVVTYGPSKDAAQLEGSKIFSSEFLRRHRIPSPDFRAFNRFDDALTFVNHSPWADGLVVKADGLAAGKGVFVCSTFDEACDALVQLMLREEFGIAGRRVVIQEKLRGFELSAQAIVDGTRWTMLPVAEDYKQVSDSDTGPNTGGMGAESPHPLVTQALIRRIEESIIRPTVFGMRRDGIPFRGTLYAGVMMTSEGPKVLEFNVRFGDPETEAILPRLANPLYPTLAGAATDQLPFEGDYPVTGKQSIVVTLASGGYPGAYETGFPISGIEDASSENGVVIFHAGTKRSGETLVTSSGRVLMVTAVADSQEEAVITAYRAAGTISFDGMQYRTDIGQRKRT